MQRSKFLPGDEEFGDLVSKRFRHFPASDVRNALQR